MTKRKQAIKYIFLVMIILRGIVAFPQAHSDYMTKLALDAGIKRPVPQKFASQIVRVPIKTDSLSMEKFHRNYVLRMRVGTGLLSGGVFLIVAHILVVAFVPHYNRNAVIATAAIGVGTMSPGSLLLPIGASERHRYKKSLRIALAQRGL